MEICIAVLAEASKLHSQIEDCSAEVAQPEVHRWLDEMLTCHNGLYKEAEHAEHGQAAVLDLLDLMHQVSVREIRCAAMQSQVT